jgi:hypothetical protein
MAFLNRAGLKEKYFRESGTCDVVVPQKNIKVNRIKSEVFILDFFDRR